VTTEGHARRRKSSGARRAAKPPKRRHAHQESLTNPHGPEGTQFGPGRRGGDRMAPLPPPVSSAESATIEEPGLRILGEIIASLERTRDAHKSDLDGQIARLKQIHEFAVKASENKAPNVPRQRAPHSVGGFLVV